MALGAEERQAFLDQLSELLAERSGEGEVRRVMETAEGYDPALWRELAELGVTGLIIDEVHGGTGAGVEALERAMEAAGSALLCAPLISSAVLAPALLQALDDPAACERLLPGLADGSRIATVALTGARGGWRREDLEVVATPSDDGVTAQLDGVAGFVTHGQIVDTLLVAAEGPDGLVVVEVERQAPGIETKPLPTFDHTLRLAQIGFAGAQGRLLKGAHAASEALEAALDIARAALAGEQAGAARRLLELTVDYARSRVQFGRSIGSFQAIKHMASDLLLESESAISAARAAARALDEGSSGAPAAVALAAFACSEAFVRVAADAVQMHGGIAFTWAHPAHLYLRRARADAQLFGTPAAERERFLTALGA